MADYYEHMSVVLPLKRGADKRKRKWWERAREAMLFLSGQGARDVGDQLDSFIVSLNLPEGAKDITICDITVCKECVCITDYAGALHTDGVAALLQAYLRAFDPEGHLRVQIAFTCSKPRADGFGGCAMVVSANDWGVKSTYLACDELELEMGLQPEKRRNTP